MRTAATMKSNRRIHMNGAAHAGRGAKAPVVGDVSGVRVEKWTVTPELALKWLETNDNNRPVSQARVQQLAKDMTDGVFELTHQGIAFDSAGLLIDGQHRLWAVVESKKTVEMFVGFGLDRSEVVHYIDDGRPRSMTDKLGYGGIDTNKRRVSVVRTMLLHYRTQHFAGRSVEPGTYTWHNKHGRVRATAFAEFHELVRPAVDFALDGCGGKAHACVAAAVGSAWYTQNHDRLAEFQQMLASGEISSKNDNSIIRLRDFLMNSGLTSGGESARCEIFVRACTALRAFCERRSLQKLYAVPTAPFPIPKFPTLNLD